MPVDDARPVFVVGDVHGHRAELVALLRDHGFVDGSLDWRAADAVLWFLGDFFDRGPDGIGVVELVMRLQQQAARSGGAVRSVLGNHEPLLLAAQRFGDAPGLSTGPDGTFVGDWQANGGVQADLQRLTPEMAAWLSDLPALAVVGDSLLMHADALLYLEYGRDLRTVNSSLRAVLHGADPAAWDLLLERFAARNAFQGEDGGGRARAMLDAFGAGRAARIVHGHTPIALQTGEPPTEVDAAHVYAGGLCANVDCGLYLGGRGFVHSLRPRATS
ncbi:metallophosphoesterase [Actinoplanes sp. CA-030573]|uniref:metallophosphoesterase n=1 Tax=Actinoplanes sp. CA-030573 TaxID=3239898 RepID=UPI003D8E6D2E